MVDDFVVSSMSKFMNVLELLNMPRAGSSYRLILNTKKRDENPDLEIICLDAGLLFTMVSQQTHSIILSSGTLAPLDTFAEELGTVFEQKLTAQHVISPNQARGYILRSFNGTLFSLTHRYFNANTREFCEAVGEFLSKLLPTIPGGLIVFVQSYSVMREFKKHWKAIKLYTTLNRIKPLFFENEKNEPIVWYQKSVDNKIGGLFIGVSRGKASEGIDFSDA